MQRIAAHEVVIPSRQCGMCFTNYLSWGRMPVYLRINAEQFTGHTKKVVDFYVPSLH